MIRIGIAGYGNLGKGVEAAVKNAGRAARRRAITEFDTLLVAAVSNL